MTKVPASKDRVCTAGKEDKTIIFGIKYEMNSSYDFVVSLLFLNKATS